MLCGLEASVCCTRDAAHSNLPLGRTDLKFECAAGVTVAANAVVCVTFAADIDDTKCMVQLQVMYGYNRKVL